MRLNIFFAVAVLAGCASTPPNMNTRVSAASQSEIKTWGYCIFRHADSFSNGSDDARLIAQTAMKLCEAEKLTMVRQLYSDNLNDAFRKGYLSAMTESMENDAAALVLKRRAALRPSR